MGAAPRSLREHCARLLLDVRFAGGFHSVITSLGALFSRNPPTGGSGASTAGPDHSACPNLAHGMNLPNYFLADLPPEASLNRGMIADACHTLKRNRAQYLASRSTASLIKTISETAESWLMPDYPFRQLLMAKGPDETGFSRPLLLEGMDAFFAQITADNLHELLVQEFGHVQRLDALVSTVPEQRAGQAAIALGPELLVHVTGGVIPNPAILSIILGILVRSAQFVKCASGTSLLPRLFAHSLYDSDQKLAACLEIAEWRGGTRELEDALFSEADCVTATGSDETLA